MTKQKSASANRDLTRARIVRDQIGKSIETVYTIACAVENDNAPKETLSVRIQSIEIVYKKFCDQQDMILDALIDLECVEEFKTDTDTGESIEKFYYDARAIAVRVLREEPAELPSSTSSCGRSPTPSFHALPKIELPKFDGTLLRWCSFRDTFISLVHENLNFSPLERYHYLLSCVSGSALSVVKTIPLTAANYTIAWAALSDRYENQRLLATAHLEQLFNFRPIATESLSALLTFVNVFQENIAAIKALGVDDLSGFILFFIGSRVLDPATRHLFENSVSQIIIPSFDVLLKFVQQRCRILENINGTGKGEVRDNHKKSTPVFRTALATRASDTIQQTKSDTFSLDVVKSCTCCRGDHRIYQCTAFKNLAVFKRREHAMSNKLCFSCLSAAHLISVCPSKFNCKTCGQRHHSLLHITKDDRESSSSSNVVFVADTPVNSESRDVQFVGTSQTTSTVLLGTAIVRVRDKLGDYHTARVLIDSGSQISAITSACVARLGLSRRKCHTEIVGLSQNPVGQVKGATSCSFTPHDTTNLMFSCEDLIILPRIMSVMPTAPLPVTVRERYGNLKLADPKFDTPSRVDMLIGGDVFPQLLRPKGDILHAAGLPSAIDTMLGWVLVGTVSGPETRPPSFTSLSVSLGTPVERLLQQFWSVEEPAPPNVPTTEDEMCEKWFANTTSRESSGRFTVALPFRDTVFTNGHLTSNEPHSPGNSSKSSLGLGDSRSQALKRLYNLETRLSKDDKLYDAYRSFMNEYLSLGHMKVASTAGKYFIPHHPIVKQDGDLSKIRVVFDASATTTSGRSLNDVLCIGPKLQIDISEVLLKCRLKKFVFMADIVKMYRQILVRPEDCLYQHILWRNVPSDPVQEFELLTVTYGVSSAPFLAIRCLHALDAEDGHLYPRAKGILTDTTYVDDIVAGADTEEELLRVQEDVIGLLRSGACDLRKWSSNSTKVLDHVPAEHRAIYPSFDPKDTPAIKILGLHWDPFTDAFGYHTNYRASPLTKRGVLSTIARLFDPMGALGPMILWAKSFMQRLWQDKLDWDAPLSLPLRNQWDQFVSGLSLLTSIAVPRHIDIRDSQDIQLLGFADASQTGYAAIVFLRVVHANRHVSVYFVTCKTKVSPLRGNLADTTWTIPRLELSAALLLARVLSRTSQAISSLVNITRIRAWTDSSIVLSWLTSDQKMFKIFITNRVAKIHSLLPQCQWSHITTENNPADPASRGLLPVDMVASRLHWTGPDFLCRSEEQWPKFLFTRISVDQLPDVKVTKEVAFVTVEVSPLNDFISRFSSFSRMQRSTAYALRFVYARLLKQPGATGSLTFAELNRATLFLVRRTQRTYFSKLYKQLSQRDSVISPPSVAQLAPFLDGKGLIRVGGRLQNTTLSFDAKHPLLLPKLSPLTSILIRHYHLMFLHAGPKLIISMLRQKFWIISGRDAVRRGIFSCVGCTRHKAVHPTPLMGQLPTARVQSPRVFTQVGMDYGGPHLLKESRRRNAKVSKHYIALFICMAVKAVHIEVVSDLTTEAFLAALDRFVARRGIPTDLYSDCGTNYVGAARQLKLLFHDANVQNTVSAHLNCNWHFNPPAAPHFGGLWEAAIKSVKYHLKRVIGCQTLTFEEFMTLTTRVESVLNSRPLSPLSSDPNDLNVLTPGHFLIGQPIQALPEMDVLHMPSNRLARWELIRQCSQSFWKRWTQEYLSTLQGRSKWFKPEPNLKEGDLVIVEAPNRPPTDWRMGRVIMVHPGQDQTVRVVTVRTISGEIKRPVTKLVKLPVDDPLNTPCDS